VRFKSHKPAADTFHNVLGIVIVRRIQSTADFTPWVLSSEHVLSLLLPAFACKSGGRQLQLTGMVVKVVTHNRSSVSSYNPYFMAEFGVSTTAPLGHWSFNFGCKYCSAHTTHVFSNSIDD
jgi:hypothetical protein